MQPGRVTADIRFGEEECADLLCTPRQPRLLLLLGAEHRDRLRHPDRLVRGKQRAQRRDARSRQARAPCCSTPATGRARRRSVSIFMPNAPSSFRPRITSSGICASRSITAASISDSQNSRNVAEERLAALSILSRAAGVRMDEVQPQSAEEQFLAEAGLAAIRPPARARRRPWPVLSLKSSVVGHRRPPKHSPTFQNLDSR